LVPPEEISMPRPFVPSSNDLNDMIRRAMAKCDADVEQMRFRDERRTEARAIRAMTNEAKAIAQKNRWGF
jgi:hypothetical protein